MEATSDEMLEQRIEATAAKLLQICNENQNIEELLQQAQYHNPHAGKSKRMKEKREVEDIGTLVHQTLEQYGGGCHFETIIDTISRRHPSLGSNLAELRKKVTQTLKGSRNTFELITNYESANGQLADNIPKYCSHGFWRLASLHRDEHQSEFSPAFLSTLIYRGIIAMGQRAHQNDIKDYIFMHWHRDFTPTDSQIAFSVLSTLNTNPLFVQDKVNPGFWTICSECLPKSIEKKEKQGARSVDLKRYRYSKEEEEEKKRQRLEQQDDPELAALVASTEKEYRDALLKLREQLTTTLQVHLDKLTTLGELKLKDSNAENEMNESTVINSTEKTK